MRIIAIGGLCLMMLVKAYPSYGASCCSGSGSLTNARLQLNEAAQVSAQLSWQQFNGYWTSRGEYFSLANSEQSLESAVSWTVRLSGSFQAGLAIPWILNAKQSEIGSETGTGLGDIRALYRWELIPSKFYTWFSAIDLVLGISIPTGRSIEEARLPMKSDATGLGSAVFSPGFYIEQWMYPWTTSLSAEISWYSPKYDSWNEEYERGVEGRFSVAGGYFVNPDILLGLATTFLQSTVAQIDDVDVDNSDRRKLSFRIFANNSITSFWAIVPVIEVDAPFTNIGKNETASIRSAIGVRYGFQKY